MKIALRAISALASFVLLHVLYKLVEDAVAGWVNDRVADALGLTAPTVAQVVDIGSFALPLLGVGAMMWLYHRSYAGSRKPQAPAEPAGPRYIGLVDLRNEARGQGWTFGGQSLHIADLELALREDALNGRLKVFGRRIHGWESLRFNALTDAEPLAPIPAEHWSEFHIDYANWGSAGANREVHSFKWGGSAPGYCDLHLEREPALRWLRDEAPRYRGHYKPRG